MRLLLKVLFAVLMILSILAVPIVGLALIWDVGDASFLAKILLTSLVCLAVSTVGLVMVNDYEE